MHTRAMSILGMLTILHRTFHKEKHCDLKKVEQKTTYYPKTMLLNFSDMNIKHDKAAWY